MNITELMAGNRAAVALATDEFLAIHTDLDRIGIPREHHGEKLSVSQRVHLLVEKGLHKL